MLNINSNMSRLGCETRFSLWVDDIRKKKPYQKKNTHPFGWVFFLVDDIGLEPMTFRTSSGCSSQLS